MLVDDLKVGKHISTAEKVFVDSVVQKIRNAGYNGPIEVVGSRKDGHRISRKSMPYLAEEEDVWRSRLDDIVARNDIPAGQIRSKVPALLPGNTPNKIRGIFSCTHPDPDLDLLLTEEPNGPLTVDYEDSDSGLVVEVYGNNDYSHLLVDITSF